MRFVRTLIAAMARVFPVTIVVITIVVAALPVLARGRSLWWEVATFVAGATLGIAVLRARRTAALAGSAGLVDSVGEVARNYLVPRELPPLPSIFVGRDSDLDDAVAHLRAKSSQGPRVVLIRGLPGIGKTSLALKIAHAVADAYPDGQLIADLGPTDPRDSAAQVDRVRRYFIDALSGPDDERTDDVDTLLRGRQVLFVLDDATSMDVVRALLPSEWRCGVIVTTRGGEARVSDMDVDGLVIDVQALDEDESLRLLAQIAGDDRVRAEEQQAKQIADLTGGHPQSVRAAAASLAERPHGRLAYVLRRLQDFRRDNRESLDVSVALLNPDERAALRALGVTNGSFSPWMLAALIDVDERTATRIADTLTSAGFLERTSVDSVGLPLFVIPQRVQEYAAALLAESTTPAERRDLAARLSAHSQRRQAIAAGPLRRSVLVPLEEGRPIEAINAARDAVALARDADDPVAEGLALAAFAEVRAELGVFEGAEDLAGSALDPRVSSELAEAWARRTLGRLHRRLHQTDDAIRQLTLALERSGDHTAERVRILRELAVVQTQRGEAGLPDAEAALAEALRLGGGAAYRFLHAGLFWAQSSIVEESDRFDESLRAIENGRSDAKREGQKLWLAWLMHREARLHLTRHQYDLARQRALQALEDFAAMNHRYGKAHCRAVVGEAFLREGRPDEARPLLEEAVENFINCGDRWAEAEAVRLLTSAYGHGAEKERLLQTAGRMFSDLGDAVSLTRVERELMS